MAIVLQSGPVMSEDCLVQTIKSNQNFLLTELVGVQLIVVLYALGGRPVKYSQKTVSLRFMNISDF